MTPLTKGSQMEMLDLTLPPQPTAPAQVRKALRTSVPVPPPELHELELIATELVTNAVKHARSFDDASIEFRLSVTEGHIRIEVRDPGPCFEATPPRLPPPDAMDQMGLFVVDRLARRWGTFVNGHGCVVWAEYERKGDSARSL